MAIDTYARANCFVKKSGFFFSALLILIAFNSCPASAETLPVDRVAAIVNEDIILYSQLEERANYIYQQLKQQGRELPPQDILLPQVLERLIIENLQLQLAQRASIKISDQEVENTIENIARQSGITPSQLALKIEKEGISFASFKKSIENEILLSRVQQAAISKRIEISEQDIDDYLNSEEGKIKSSDSYHIANIVIDAPQTAGEEFTPALSRIASEVADKIRSGVSFSDLAKQYSSAPNSKEGGDLGWRSLQDLPKMYRDPVTHLKSGDISPPMYLDDSMHIIQLIEKRSRYDQWIQQTHVRHILVKPSVIRNDNEAIELLKELRNRIAAGEEFSTLAASYSEDYSSALKGGDLGWVNPGQLVPAFEEVMNNISIGAISNPFQSQYGWHILEVLDRKNENMTEELLRLSVKNYLAKQQFETELPLWLQELRAEAYVVIKDPSLQLPKQ